MTALEERAKLGLEALSKQPKVTYEEMLASVRWIKERANIKNKKGQEVQHKKIKP